jgi:integrase
MAAKPRLTDAGLLSEGFGTRPYTVRLREQVAGGPVLLDFGKPRKWETLGYVVRRAAGPKRWAWDIPALERARKAAEDKSAQMRLGQLREAAKPDPLTVGQAFALYHDPEKGGLPAGMTSIHAHRRARREWTAHLGAGTPWNLVTPADVEALLAKKHRAGQHQTAWELLKNLRACYNWLRKKRRMKQLEDPTEGISGKDLLAGVVRNRPRYTPAEAAKIFAADVDPRLRLLVALIDDTGTRREAVRRTMRSHVDAPQDVPPAPEHYPHGWICFPALKGQMSQPTPCTAFMRREMDRALTTYLRQLEEEYQRTGRDYPLLPAVSPGQVADGVVRARRWTKLEVGPARKTAESRGPNKLAYRPLSPSRTRELLIDAERIADVAHIPGRGFHGLRRAWSDLVHSEAGLEVLTTAGGWSSQRTPESIYVEKGRHKLRSAAREVMERKRGEG